MGWFRSSTARGDESAPSYEDRLAAIGPGIPGRCPACDGLGYIDNLDIGHRFQIQHCKDCGHRWEYLFDGDGVVVGITELDDDGHPVARMRVRNRPLVAERRPTVEEPLLAPLVDEAAPAQPAPPADPADPADPAEPAEPEADGPPADEADLAGAGGGSDDVIDLRDPEAGPDEPAHMSPAEWLRHALGR